MKKMMLVLLAVAFAVILAACAFSQSKDTITGKPGVIRGEELVLKATIVSVDLGSRVVTLKDSAGDVRDFRVGPEAVNLAQVKAGDIVTVRFIEAVAVEVIKPGMAAGAGESTTIVRAKPGEMPGGMITRQVKTTATVKGIDKPGATVSLMGPNGKTVKVKVADVSNLDKIKIGDELLITFIEAEAITVTRAE